MNAGPLKNGYMKVRLEQSEQSKEQFSFDERLVKESNLIYEARVICFWILICDFECARQSSIQFFQTQAIFLDF